MSSEGVNCTALEKHGGSIIYLGKHKTCGRNKSNERRKQAPEGGDHGKGYSTVLQGPVLRVCC